MHAYACLFACLHRDPRYPDTLHSLSALFPEGKVSLNMKFTVLVRLSSQLTPSQLTPSMSLPRVLTCGHPQFYMGAGVSNSGHHVCTATLLESPSSEL